MLLHSEIAGKADFSKVRYAQVWEDAEVMLAALDIQAQDVCLSIASAGDNALAMLTRSPKKVFALDLNPSQIYCLELRVAAFRKLSHEELLELVGSTASVRRQELYFKCRDLLSRRAKEFWDNQTISSGIGSIGKFERYFGLFRRIVLPLFMSRTALNRFFEEKNSMERKVFFDKQINNWRFRWATRLFFSNLVMGRLGRDPAFFTHVRGSLSQQVAARVRHAFVQLDPSRNPYLRWIMTGSHQGILPVYLRSENFEIIKANLNRLEWRQESLEGFLQGEPVPIDKANLSDIFEYMSVGATNELLEQIAKHTSKSGRLVYWNMMVARSRPDVMASVWRPLAELSASLHQIDQAFFYQRVVVEEKI